MTIKREILRQHLHNTPLVQTIEQKQQIDITRKKLREALQIMSEIEVSETAIADVQSKYDEYGKISSGYSNLLEDVFGISWQTERIICKYTDCLDEYIDNLSENIKYD